MSFQRTLLSVIKSRDITLNYTIFTPKNDSSITFDAVNLIYEFDSLKMSVPF